MVAKTACTALAKNTTPAASPSRPSIRLMAFMRSTNQNTVTK